MTILDHVPLSKISLHEGVRIKLPSGMVGLPKATEFELIKSQEGLPIMWLRSTGSVRMSFPVIEPGPFVPNYELELEERDAEFLGEFSAANPPLVLTVLTVKSLAPQRVTINLIGPLVINRETLVGKQVLLVNYERYSVEHPVIDEAASCEAGKC